MLNIRINSIKTLLLTLLMIVGISPVALCQPLNINTGFTAPVFNLLEDIIQLTFNRAGIDFRFRQQSGERSIALVARGIDDAECCRVPQAIVRDYPDLIQVPEVVYVARFSAFAKKPLPEIINFESLKPYSVATVSGWKILINNLQKVKPEVFHIMENEESMFKILQMERIDIATFGYLGGLEIISSLELNDIDVIDPPLATAPLYLYLNKKHEKLAPKIAKALKELKAEGKIDEIISSYENR